MSTVQSFLTAEEEREVVAAIAIAEKKTSAEIRIHLEEHCPDEVLDRAAYVFAQLQMQQTKARNGVLIYIAVSDRKMCIIGDAGINALVKNDFWDHSLAELRSHFKMGAYKTGLITAIHTISDLMSNHFPYNIADINELSNEISYG